MRSVCFVNRLELEFEGNVCANSVCLGDVDNDGENELVVGTTGGDLYTYKGDRLWQVVPGLGMITSVGVGDIMNCGSNAVVVISGDGWCYIYLCLDSSQVQGSANLQLVHSQRIPANTKVLVLGDVQGDGQVDMVIGLTDRVVRIYRWLQTAAVANLVCLNKCECANQIGSICLGKRPDGSPCILVSQPRATYMTITHKSSPTEDSGMCVEYHKVTSSNKSWSSNINAEILGNIKDDDTLALSLIDGTVVLIKEHQLVWSSNLEQQIFALGKAKICDDGQDQLVAGCWMGQTFILDLHGNTVCFELGQKIQGFTCGPYMQKAAPAFIYVTFNNKIYVYYDLKLESIECHGVLSLQKEDPRFSHMSFEDLRVLNEYLVYHFDSPCKPDVISSTARDPDDKKKSQQS